MVVCLCTLHVPLLLCCCCCCCERSPTFSVRLYRLSTDKAFLSAAWKRGRTQPKRQLPLGIQAGTRRGASSGGWAFKRGRGLKRGRLQAAGQGGTRHACRACGAPACRRGKRLGPSNLALEFAIERPWNQAGNPRRQSAPAGAGLPRRVISMVGRPPYPILFAPARLLIFCPAGHLFVSPPHLSKEFFVQLPQSIEGHVRFLLNSISESRATRMRHR